MKRGAAVLPAVGRSSFAQFARGGTAGEAMQVKAYTTNSASRAGERMLCPFKSLRG